jgi:hypothetical protein
MSGNDPPDGGDGIFEPGSPPDDGMPAAPAPHAFAVLAWRWRRPVAAAPVPAAPLL